MKILIVDDSSSYRRILQDACAEIPNVEVVGNASNGETALALVKRLRPDIVLLDIHMPGISGIDVLNELRVNGQRPCVVVITTNSNSSIKNTTKALEVGAFDFVLKPNTKSIEQNRVYLASKLSYLFRAFAGTSLQTHTTTDCPLPIAQSLVLPTASFEPSPAEIVVIGISTGGPSALMEVIPAIPGDFELPILIVQHMPPTFTQQLAQNLNQASPLIVQEAQNDDPIQPGRVYIAPGGMMMKVESTATSQPIIRITDGELEDNCCQSADYLLQSVASVYGPRTFVAIMTGMGSDGAQGCEYIAQKGGTIITQDEESSVVYGMPRRVVEAGLSSESCSLQQITTRITQAAKERNTPCPY